MGRLTWWGTVGSPKDELSPSQFEEPSAHDFFFISFLPKFVEVVVDIV